MRTLAVWNTYRVVMLDDGKFRVAGMETVKANGHEWPQYLSSDQHDHILGAIDQLVDMLPAVDPEDLDLNKWWRARAGLSLARDCADSLGYLAQLHMGLV